MYKDSADKLDMLRCPGLYSPNDLREFANRLSSFLQEYREIESIMGGHGALNVGSLVYYIEHLNRTADINEQRGPLND